MPRRAGARCLSPALVARGVAVPTLASPGTPLTALLVPWCGLGRGAAALNRRVAEGAGVSEGVYWFPGAAGPLSAHSPIRPHTIHRVPQWVGHGGSGGHKDKRQSLPLEGLSLVMKAKGGLLSPVCGNQPRRDQSRWVWGPRGGRRREGKGQGSLLEGAV